jgi:hypothetical protein
MRVLRLNGDGCQSINVKFVPNRPWSGMIAALQVQPLWFD